MNGNADADHTRRKGRTNYIRGPPFLAYFSYFPARRKETPAMKLDELLKKKSKEPEQAPAASDTKTVSEPAPETDTTPAPFDPFAALRNKVAMRPAPARVPKTLTPDQAAVKQVENQMAEISSMPMAFGDMTMQAESTAKAPAPVEPTQDPELKSQHQQAIHYYQQQVDRYQDNVVIQTLYNHLLTVTKSLRTPEITDAFHTAAEYIAQNPELRPLLKPFDIGQLVQALQASTGRVIAKKTERTAKTTAKKKNMAMLESMFDGMGL